MLIIRGTVEVKFDVDDAIKLTHARLELGKDHHAPESAWS